MWGLMKDADYRAAKWGGKRDSIELGHLTCNAFDKHGVRKTLNFMDEKVEESFSTQTGRDWAVMAHLAAPLTLCPEHRSAVDYHLGS